MTAKLGWCLTGHHTTCPVQLHGHQCACKCHPENHQEKDSK